MTDTPACKEQHCMLAEHPNNECPALRRAPALCPPVTGACHRGPVIVPVTVSVCVCLAGPGNLRTEPDDSITPLGVRNMPDPIIVPTMSPTPLKTVSFFFNCTSSTVVDPVELTPDACFLFADVAAILACRLWRCQCQINLVAQPLLLVQCCYNESVLFEASMA